MQATNTNNTRSLQNSQSMVINSNNKTGSLLAVGRAHSLTNMPSQSTSSRRQRVSVDEGDYDDTVIEQQPQSGKDNDRGMLYNDFEYKMFNNFIT